MIQPTARAVLLAAAGFPVALLPAVVHARLWGVWLVVAAATVLLVGVDALLAFDPARLEMDLAVPDTVPIGDSGRIEVELRAPHAADVEVLVELHPDLEPAPARRVAVAKGVAAAVAFPLVARRRGRPTVDEIWCRWPGPLGLVRRQVRRTVGRVVSVVPNLASVRAAAFEFQGSKELQAGVQVERFVGEGSEFDALREYVPGLDHRAISWKASARHRRLLCQEFRAERNHQVILALDTGHLMGEPLAGVPRLDHAVSAALHLGYVSLRLGDRVGLFAFDRTARAWTAAQGGMGAFSRLRAASAQLDYSHEETNFTLGLAELSTRLRRRSLVVVFTDFVDTVTAEVMLDNLARLARRQLVVFVAVRDPSLESVARAAPRRMSDVYRSVVAADLALERDRVLARLRRLGILCVDAAPGAISTRLVSRYMEIKRRELV